MKKFRLYIDEVGNSDLGSSSNPNHRYLSLTGVIIDLEYVASTVFPAIEELKRQYFDSHPDEPIILHRKVKPKSNNIAGLQLADLIAHPSSHVILAHRRHQPLPDNFGGEIGKILEKSKYIRSAGGRIDGWGRKWLP